MNEFIAYRRYSSPIHYVSAVDPHDGDISYTRNPADARIFNGATWREFFAQDDFATVERDAVLFDYLKARSIILRFWAYQIEQPGLLPDGLGEDVKSLIGEDTIDKLSAEVHKRHGEG